MKTRQIETDLSVWYERTSLGLEIRTEAELAPILEALQDDTVSVIHLHDHYRRVTINLHLRFRE